MKKEEMLQQLREYFMDGSIFRLVNFDNKAQEMLGSITSIFDYDIRDMIENGFSYNVAKEDYPEDNVDAFDFEFELVEDNENVLDIKVKITNIDWV